MCPPVREFLASKNRGSWRDSGGLGNSALAVERNFSEARHERVYFSLWGRVSGPYLTKRNLAADFAAENAEPTPIGPGYSDYVVENTQAQSWRSGLLTEGL